MPGLYLGMYAYNDSIVWSCGRRIVLNTLTGGLTNVNYIHALVCVPKGCI
ncbi:MAG: hypothetical protein LH629_15125 [Ignavibacteria bacterium]|nr:hypothetical protein [Ignavibacteria bacterium]